MAIVLTGDRPTGKLHLGHYAGSLISRKVLQDQHTQYIMIADTQALTDNASDAAKVTTNVYELAADYLAVGLDKSTIFIQSQVPAISELAIYYLNLVSIARLQRNPTVKSEIQQKGYSEDLPAGFLCYPVSQAADITSVRADIVPAGSDQMPMIEQTNEIVRKFNRLYNSEYLKEASIYLSAVPRLTGLDGKAKMSKSLGNAIYLADEPEEIKRKVFLMFTDPDHLKASDPGRVEGNVVFTYLDAFHSDTEYVAELKAHYQRGGLGDVTIKNILNDRLQQIIGPIRERRAQLSKDMIYEKLLEGTQKVQLIAQQTVEEVKAAMGLNYFKKY